MSRKKYLNRWIKKFRTPKNTLDIELEQKQNKKNDEIKAIKDTTTEKYHLKSKEELLLQSRLEFIGMFRNSPKPIVYTDLEGYILEVNGQLEKLLSSSQDELRGKKITQYLIDYPEQILNSRQNWENIEATLKKENNQNIFVSISSSLNQVKGKIIGRIWIIDEITGRKFNENLHKVLYNISRLANSNISLNKLYTLIRKEISTFIDTTNFYIILFNEEDNQLYFAFYTDETGEKEEVFFISKADLSNSIFGYIFKKGKSLLLNYREYKKMVERGDFNSYDVITNQQSWLGVPLKVEDRVIGVMAVISYTNPQLYSEDEVKLLEFISSQVAIVIERKRSEEALKESQQEFASLFQSSPEALVYLDEQGNILNLNPRFTELFGYSLEEVKGKNIDSGIIHPPDKLEEGRNLYEQSLQGHFYFETIRKKKDGTLFPVAISGSRVIVDGKLKGLIGIFQDITERKKMEEELERLAHYDVFTGCYTRAYGLILLEQQIRMAKRKNTPLLLFYLDVNDFKSINDTFGHQEGDKVLNQVVTLFQSTLREVDIICRMGGDEFLLIFPESSLQDAPLIKERIDKNLKKLNQKLAKSYSIGLSIGLSAYDPSNPLTIEELIQKADEKMYEEKKRKKKMEFK